jgi:hypothetical protein
MPKIGKNHLIKKSKLVKTTTFVTLLIAATLLFSSIGPATMVNNEVNDNEMNTLDLGNDANALTPPQPSEISQVFEKHQYCEVTPRETVVWDNGFNYIGLYRSEIGPGVTSEIADDFIFSAEQKVNDVHWIGGYWGGTKQTPWCIKFYEDAGGKPGADFAGPFCYDWDDIEKVPEGSYWAMSVDIPNVIFSAGQRYWIVIYADGDAGPPYCGPAMHWTPITELEAMWRWPEYGYPDWVSTNAITGYGPADMCFKLTVKAEHDVGIDSIDAPIDYEEICGCLDVAVTAGNYGSNDETDVPVWVEIRRTIFANSFEEPMGAVWDISGVDCGWSITAVDTGTPSVVTPHSGSFMAELNSGNGGANGNCLLYEIEPEDLSEFCEPWMSFWMWHDKKGSDDYLEVWVDPGTGFEFLAGPYTRLCCPGCPTGWAEHKVSLAAFAGLTFLRIGFKGYCDSNPGAYNLHIDDVTKYDQEYFAETTVDIPVAEKVEVEFEECWEPCLWGELFDATVDFEIVACTGLDIDENHGNDCLSDMVTLYFPFEVDIASISIDEPAEPIAGANPMEGTIKNVGGTAQFCFKAKMGVYDLIINELFEETFDNWERDPNQYPSYYYAYRPVGWMEYGCSYEYGWEKANTNYAGGTAPEARLYYYYACYYQNNIIESPTIDTTGYVSLELEFKSFIDWYYGSTYCNMYVEVYDGSWHAVQPWSNPISGNVGPDTYIVQIADYADANMKIRFRFYGYYWYFDYWYVDDVKIIGKYCAEEAEYFEEVCVGDPIEPCEEVQLEFPDWTPALPWPDCGSQNYCICLEVNPCDPLDENPANNKICIEVTVDFWRDVELTFSSPAPEAKTGTLLWDNGPDNGLNGLSCMYWPSYPLDREVADDFFNDDYWSVTSAGFSGTTYYCSQPGDVNEIRAFFYEDDGGEPVVDRYAERLATDFTVTAVGCELTYECEFDEVILPPGTWWVCLQPEFEDNGFWNTADGQGSPVYVSYPDYGAPKWTPGIDVFGVDYDVTFQLYGEVGVSPGPPIPDVFIGCGEQDLCVNIENLGDFDESVDVTMQLYEFVTDPETATLVMDVAVDNVAILVGATEEVCFGTYDFADAGVYLMVAEAILLPDCDPSNNGDSLGIGVDCCPPESMHEPTPLIPDGENNWYTVNVRVEISATDPPCPDPCWGTSSGVAAIHYVIDDGDEIVVPDDSTVFNLNTDGVHLVKYWAVDNAGNEEDFFTFEIAIDKSEPDVDLFYTVYEDDAGAWHVDFEIRATDATSGNARADCFIGTNKDKEYEAPPYDTWTVDWIDDYADLDFIVEAYDNAGNMDDAEVSGSEIDDQIDHARSHATAHSILSSRTHSVTFNQQPRSR